MLTYNNSVLTFGSNHVWLKPPSAPTPDPYNPLGLPAYTMRFQFSQSGFDPRNYVTGGTWAQVSVSPNVWDWTYENTNWSYKLSQLVDGEYVYTYVDVLGANTTGVTSMRGLFYGNAYEDIGTMLRSVVLFDTSAVTNMTGMFRYCYRLQSIPLYPTNSVTNMDYAFADCKRVESGSLALYNQASSQSTPPTTYANCFKNCGTYTVTGAAELTNIPSSWGGTGA